MNSIDVYVVVEGPTEQTFVRDVLAPKMAPMGISLYPTLIGKPGHKGGDVRFSRAKKDIGNFLRQRTDTYISTMFDYFRLDADWPGKVELRQSILSGTSLTASQKAEILESETLNEIVKSFAECDPSKRFVPYIEMHEFEALLFSDARILAEKTGIDLSRINGVLEAYSNPEEIDDDPAKAPGKRLVALKNGYRKVAMGKAVSEAIGVHAIRSQCPHFNDWLMKFEHIVGRAHGKA